MAVFAVYIQKETQYMGETRPFGNTYHYQTDTAQLFNDEAVATRVLQNERGILSSDATITGWRTWGPTDVIDKRETVIREEGVVSLVGQGLNDPALYAENCLLMSWEIERSPTTNRRRWLRKFFRMPGPVSTPFTPGILRGSLPLDAANIASYEGAFNSQAEIQNGLDGFVNLTNAQGDAGASLGPVVCRPFLITRDIGR